MTNGQQEKTVYELAREFTDFLNKWHSYREPYDDDLDAWLYEEYAKIKRKRNVSILPMRD